MTSFAVIDLGSARSKLTIGIRNGSGETSFERFKAETGIATTVGRSGYLPETDILECACKLRDIAASKNCHFAAVIGTDAFRRAANATEVVHALEPIIGAVNVLSANAEGAILFGGVSSVLMSISSLVVVDVGGGSVQVAWGPSTGEVASFPLGTFRLEGEFQREGEAPSLSEFRSILDHVRSVYSSGLPPALRAETVAFGSNCMEDFIRSALSASQWMGETHLTPLVVSTDALKDLLREVSFRPYGDLARYYPSNPNFMKGADKALINILSIADLVGATQLIPTNESISTSLARRFLDGEDLARQGIMIVTLAESANP